ncbi:MAG TPA: hypothetical protein PLS95_12125, partial [Thermoanaerobaculales bacterium]|nr:hypothetical protein [Thermoanaerobaculales bacterium]
MSDNEKTTPDHAPAAPGQPAGAAPEAAGTGADAPRPALTDDEKAAKIAAAKAKAEAAKAAKAAAPEEPKPPWEAKPVTP